jgi:hypothetical protein
MEAMNTTKQTVINEQAQYVPPVVRVMSEAEILSAFQVNAAGTMGWWVA